MNEFMLWFVKPIAEALGTLAMVMAFSLAIMLLYMSFYWYTLAEKWFKTKFKKKND